MLCFIILCTENADGCQSAFYGKAKPDEERFKVLDACYDAGELFWDSADMYQDSEDLLGMVSALRCRKSI